MRNQDLYQLFIQELEDMYNSENQIIAFFPKAIMLACSIELAEALSHHLKETENQVTKIERIFSRLGEKKQGRTCLAMKGILGEIESIIKNKTKSSLLDAALISGLQKVEHYEIASYSSLRSFAKHLSLKSEVIDLLQEILNEENTADKKLTKIAEGSFFTPGINEDAVIVGESRVTSSLR